MVSPLQCDGGPILDLGGSEANRLNTASQVEKFSQSSLGDPYQKCLDAFDQLPTGRQVERSGVAVSGVAVG